MNGKVKQPFVVLPQTGDFPNGPDVRHVLTYQAPQQLGPTWSMFAVTVDAENTTPVKGLLTLRCLAVHPNHDCQCVFPHDPAGHRTSHRCWHGAEWPARRREGLRFVEVPSRRLASSSFAEPGNLFSEIIGAHVEDNPHDYPDSYLGRRRSPDRPAAGPDRDEKEA